MIESLKAKARFQSSGACIDFTFQPKTGFTAVVGGNGTGKSFMTIEVPRWLLFGKAALRGEAGDYSNTHAEGVFRIRGARYRIERGKKDTIWSDDGTVLAVGAEKVTEKVVELLGYGLEVFDLCNAALQGEVNKLGELKPAARKRLVDRVFGLRAVEDTEKDCKAQAALHRRRAEAMAETLPRVRDEPVRPADYLPSASIKSDISNAAQVRNQRAALRERFKPLPLLPTKPEIEYCPRAHEDLIAYQEERALIEKRHWQLNQLKHVPEISLETLEKAKAHLAYRRDIEQRGARPTMARDEIQKLLSDWQQISFLEANAEDAECPKCHHKFRTDWTKPATPAISREDLNAELEAHYRWKDEPVEPEKVDMTAEEIMQAEHAYNVRQNIGKIGPIPDDMSAQLSQVEERQRDWQTYERQMKQYREIAELNALLQAELDALPEALSDDAFGQLYERHQRAQHYENECRDRVAEQEAFDKVAGMIAEERRLAEAFQEGAKALADTRAELKAIIAPKISTIASALINEMSAGALTSVLVDDEMNITVDGQKLHTLSGAGKTVANLALRVAMGQALVAHAFPVFLADEIDGDMEPARREATLTALSSLKHRLDQVLLVTHRDVDLADYVKTT